MLLLSNKIQTCVHEVWFKCKTILTSFSSFTDEKNFCHSSSTFFEFNSSFLSEHDRKSMFSFAHLRFIAFVFALYVKLKLYLITSLKSYVFSNAFEDVATT